MSTFCVRLERRYLRLAEVAVASGWWLLPYFVNMRLLVRASCGGAHEIGANTMRAHSIQPLEL